MLPSAGLVLTGEPDECEGLTPRGALVYPAAAWIELKRENGRADRRIYLRRRRNTPL